MLTPLDKLGGVVKHYYDKTVRFYRLDKMMILSAVIEQVRYYVKNKLENVPPNGPHPLLTMAEYNSVKKIYNLYFKELWGLEDTDFFRRETGN